MLLSLVLAGAAYAAPQAWADDSPAESATVETSPLARGHDALHLRLIGRLGRIPDAATATKPPHLIGSEHPEFTDTALAETLLAVLKATLQLASVAIIALLAYTTLVRLRRRRNEQRRQQFRERWQGLLYRRMAGDRVDLPAVAPAERAWLLLLLIELKSFVRGDSADALMAISRACGMAVFVMQLLASRRPWRRGLGVRGAAMMRFAESMVELERLIVTGSPQTALFAASALLQIDAQRGFAALEPLMWRLDWSTERIAALIKSASGSPAHLVSTMLATAPPNRVKQVVRLIELLGERSLLPAVRSRLAASTDPVASAAILHALGTLGDLQDRDTVMSYLKHPEPLLRLQASFALGRLGFAADAKWLTPLLRDANWWIRYRAAQSMLQLAGAERTRLAASEESDNYARAALERVLAEQH